MTDMKCVKTDVPDASEIDIPAIRAKYKIEREKRMHPSGQKQYVRPVGEFAENYEADPYTPMTPREPLDEETDVAVLGAGFTGLLAGVHLRNAGVKNFRIFDHAGDFGGVWYWNRYPGIQCDNDSYIYLPLLEEMGYMPSQKYANGHEIYEYCQKIADKHGLYENALFHTVIESIRWDPAIQRYQLTTNRGDKIRARFVVLANGLLNIPKLPGVPGIGDFKGKMFHTARWDYDYTGGDWKNLVLDKLKDKKVAIVGTGATAIQAIPYLGKYAEQLYVIQRTPSTVDLRYNAPTDPEWAASLKPGWQKERILNFHHAAMERFARGEPDLIRDFWTELNRNLSAELEEEGWPELSYEEFMARREEMDFRVMERMRRRVDALIDDKETAESLKPWYRFLCKRPLSNDDYYPTFNQPNVKLIDVADTRGVEKMTEKGFVHRGQEYEIDCMIFASGFEVTSDLERRWGIDVIEGRDGRSIYDVWGEDVRTLHGAMSHGFPNMFFTGYVQGGLNASTTEQYGAQGYHIAYIVSEALKRGLGSVEPSVEAQDAYVEHLRATAIDISDFQAECTPSYFNNEGDDAKGKRWYLGESYGPGWGAFSKMLDDWRSAGKLEGMILEEDKSAN